MKATKKIILTLFVLFVLLNACKEHETEVYQNSDGRFMRFNLLLNNNGEPFTDQELNQKANLASELEYKRKETLRIPVTLTSEVLADEVSATFSTEYVGDYEGWKVRPENGLLSFSGNQLSDTIEIEFSERWEPEGDNKMIFRLESVSDEEIQLGFPSKLDRYDVLSVSLGELALTYRMQDESRIELEGVAGEVVYFDVYFPFGFFANEIQDNELLEVRSSGFDYSLELLPFDGTEEKVSYKFTLNEDLDVDVFSYSVIFDLAELDGYHISGQSSLTIVKPEKVDRDKSLNTASYFYDLDNIFYRTYGETWMDYNKDGECKWQSFNAFTYPVVVDSNHPDAILYDDQGTADPVDDIYHHAFRVGFNSPNEGRTTNSFNLKRLLDNEYTDADKSPGFNIVQALEFYPENGTDPSKGIVKVISQDIIISNKDDKSYLIQIGGFGSYSEISDGIFKLEFNLELTNEELFGGTVQVPYVLFNTNEYDDPVELGENCFQPFSL